MGFEQTFLYISAERSIKAGICQLILMMFIFGCDLFQSIDSLVIGIGCGSVLFIESHDPFRFGLYLTVFSFRSVQLYLIVSRIQFGQDLPSRTCAPSFTYILLIVPLTRKERLMS